MRVAGPCAAYLSAVEWRRRVRLAAATAAGFRVADCSRPRARRRQLHADPNVRALAHGTLPPSDYFLHSTDPLAWPAELFDAAAEGVGDPPPAAGCGPAQRGVAVRRFLARVVHPGALDRAVARLLGGGCSGLVVLREAIGASVSRRLPEVTRTNRRLGIDMTTEMKRTL
jgi:hypothetical protein